MTLSQQPAEVLSARYLFFNGNAPDFKIRLTSAPLGHPNVFNHFTRQTLN